MASPTLQPNDLRSRLGELTRLAMGVALTGIETRIACSEERRACLGERTVHIDDKLDRLLQE